VSPPIHSRVGGADLFAESSHAVRMNILCNPTGKKGHFRPIDWIIEHNNLYIKVSALSCHCYDRDNRPKSGDKSRVREVGSVILSLYQNAFQEVLSEVEQIERLLVKN